MVVLCGLVERRELVAPICLKSHSGEPLLPFCSFFLSLSFLPPSSRFSGLQSSSSVFFSPFFLFFFSLQFHLSLAHTFEYNSFASSVSLSFLLTQSRRTRQCMQYADRWSGKLLCVRCNHLSPAFFCRTCVCVCIYMYICLCFFYLLCCWGEKRKGEKRVIDQL